MNDTLLLVLSGAAGIVLGAFFFGGLWWTIRKALASTRSAFWFLGSLLVRTAVVLTAFYAIGGGDWRRLIACLLGFVVARFGVMRFTRSTGAAGAATDEARHAPYA